MESSEPGSMDDTIDSKNLETAAEDDLAKYEDPETISSQNEEDQSGEQVYGYLYRSSGSEDATIIVDSRGFNLNGQSLIVTQNDDGNEIIVLVEDPDGQPLDQTFAHSILQSDEVSFEDGLKEHGKLVVDERSQSLEFMKSDEMPEEQEERQMYIENRGEILNISNENVGSPVAIEPNLWSVSNSGHLKNDGTEMLFIPSPTVVLAPEETRHRKLMQLACIAHELQSADQKSSSSVICDYGKDPETSVNEFENSVKNTQEYESAEKNSADEEVDKCLSHNEREKCISFNSKSTKVVSPTLSGATMRALDNTVSVIHSTSSEIPDNSLENQTKLSSPSDFSSDKTFPNSESELHSEMLYPNISNAAFHDTFDGSSSIKQLEEECSRDGLEENSRFSMSDDRCSAQNNSLDLHNTDSPLTFIEKSHKFDDANSKIEDSASDDVDPDMKIDEDSHANSSIDADDEIPKSHDSNNSLSLTECHISKEINITERISEDGKVPNEACSELNNASDVDDDNISSTEHSMSVSENETSFKYSVFNYKEKAIEPSLVEQPVMSAVLQNDEPLVENIQVDSNESNMQELKIDETKTDENVKSDFAQSPTENFDCDLVIAETFEETNTNIMDKIESTKDDSILTRDLKSNSSANDNEELISVDQTSVSPDLTYKSSAITDSPKESNDDKNTDKVVLGSRNSSPASDERLDSEILPFKSIKKACITRETREDKYSSDEETPLMRVKKTYSIKKKMKKSTFENKITSGQEIQLFIDLDERDSDKNHDNKESSSVHENSTEDDPSLGSDVQSKVSAQRTYAIIQKEKCFFRKKKSVSSKQGLRSHSLRSRSLSSSLLLRNGNSDISDNDSKKNCLDSGYSDNNIPWGKVLLETSFQPLPNDVPSTSFAPQYPKETSTPLLSPEQRRRKINKTGRDFDRLLNSSSPIATKQPKIGKKFSSRAHPNVIKATKSKFSSSQFSRISKSSSVPLSSGLLKSSCGKKMPSQKPKEAKIQFLSSASQPEHSYPNKDEMYTCSSCNFSSIYVDNLMEHLKYCSNRQPVFDYEVNNMDKRQRIRGEEEIANTVNNTLKKIRSDLRNALMDEDPSVSFPSLFREEERDSDNVRKRKSLYRQYGYGEDDVVWVKFKDRFWPALVCDIAGLTAYVKLISYPKEVKGLKVKHENIRTFDNSKWNLLCLAEAESLPHNEIFVKAVQSCERFMSKKFLGVHVTGKEFFSVRDEVDFATDSASTDSILNEDSDSELEIGTEPARKARYEKLDIQRIFNHIIEGKADSYVLDIYNKRTLSKKHLTFFETDSSDLKHKPWFGPFEDTRQQEELFSHFRDLFLEKIGKKGFFVSYVCQVWIPEAIVKAISVVKDIPIKDAELLFESEDSLDLENEDPSVEEILKKYS